MKYYAVTEKNELGLYQSKFSQVHDEGRSASAEECIGLQAMVKPTVYLPTDWPTDYLSPCAFMRMGTEKQPQVLSINYPGKSVQGIVEQDVEKGAKKLKVG